MKSDNDRNVDTFEAGEFSREPVPSTDALQASILESARQLPQHVPLQVASTTAAPRNWFSWYRPALYSPALIAAAFVVIVSVYTVNFGDSQPLSEAFSENDLEWQELMLIEDDLLFAQL